VVRALRGGDPELVVECPSPAQRIHRLQNIVFALALSRHARRVIYQNLAFALAVIIVLVVSALGFSLVLPIGVIAHEGSAVLVCLNGLRMLTFRTPTV
jgi:Zn2+/Cd2+-exporting ATPase